MAKLAIQEMKDLADQAVAWADQAYAERTQNIADGELNIDWLLPENRVTWSDICHEFPGLASVDGRLAYDAARKRAEKIQWVARKATMLTRRGWQETEHCARKGNRKSRRVETNSGDLRVTPTQARALLAYRDKTPSEERAQTETTHSLKEAIRVAREHLQQLGVLAHQLAAGLDHDSPDTGELLDKAAAASSAVIRLRVLQAAPPDLTAEWLAIPEHIRAAIRAADKDGRWRVAVHGEEAIGLGLCRAGKHPRHYLTPRAATLRAHAASVGLR